MEISIKEFSIRPDRYQYRLVKRKGKNQFTTIGYYGDLKQAVLELFEQLQKEDASSLVIDEGTVDVEGEIDRLLSGIEKMKQKIIKVIKSMEVKNENSD